MPTFRYTAVTATSETIEGRMEAPDRSGLVDRIHALGYIPLRVEQIGSSALASLLSFEIGSKRRLRPRALALITGQLASLIKAGLPLDEALLVLQDLVETGLEKKCLARLLEKVSAGASLSDAMAAQKQVFPEHYVSMIRAGEAGASLDQTLERLADFLERVHGMRETIKSALIYPATIAVVCCVSVAILFLYVIPRFRPLFEQSGDQLPLPARLLMQSSDALQSWWWLAPVLGVAMWLYVRRQGRDSARRQRWEGLAFRLPMLGELIRKIEVARFCRTLGTLLRNGVSLLPALQITVDTVRSRLFVDAVRTIIERARTGKGLAEPMRHTKVFPQLATHFVRVGEESGRQEEMLLKVADIFEADIQRQLARVLGLLGPAVTIGLGVVVAGVIMSIMTALLSVYDLTM